MKTVVGSEEPLPDTYHPPEERERRRGLWWLIPRLSLEWCGFVKEQTGAEQGWNPGVCAWRGDVPTCFLINSNLICRSGTLWGWLVSLGDGSNKIHSNSQTLWSNKQWSTRWGAIHQIEPPRSYPWPPWELVFLWDHGKRVWFLSVLMPPHLFLTSLFFKNQNNKRSSSYQTWLLWPPAVSQDQPQVRI